MLGEQVQPAGHKELSITEATLTNTGQTAAVIDGMGGMGGGDIAASWLAHRWSNSRRPLQPAPLSQQLQADNEALLAMAQETPTPQMGAAATAVIFHPNHVLLHHVGDTRAYHLTASSCTQLTLDHVGPRGGLTQCFGGGARQAAYHKLQPMVAQHAYWDDGLLLLVSDGVWPYFSPALLQQVYATKPEPKALGLALAAFILEGPAADNLTILAIKLV